jgi:hypothetical protein
VDTAGVSTVDDGAGKGGRGTGGCVFTVGVDTLWVGTDAVAPAGVRFTLGVETVCAGSEACRSGAGETTR